MNVPLNLTDMVFNSPLVPTLYGTPPQLINTTLDLNSAKMAVYSSSCVLCSGNTSFNPTLSTTFQVLSMPYTSTIVTDRHTTIGAELFMAVQHSRLLRKCEQRRDELWGHSVVTADRVWLVTVPPSILTAGCSLITDLM